MILLLFFLLFYKDVFLGLKSTYWFGQNFFALHLVNYYKITTNSLYILKVVFYESFSILTFKII